MVNAQCPERATITAICKAYRIRPTIGTPLVQGLSRIARSGYDDY